MHDKKIETYKFPLKKFVLSYAQKIAISDGTFLGENTYNNHYF